MKINIKTLSVNRCWKGQRFKTNEYKNYEKHMLILLKPMDIPDGKLEVSITVGFSNPASDLDNILKPLIDILQKKYEFNDNRVYKLVVEKDTVKKGCEYIDFEINGYK